MIAGNRRLCGWNDVRLSNRSTPIPATRRSATSQQVGTSFEKRAGHYDNPATAYIGEHELRVIRQLVPAGSTLLDYGCGTGRSALDHARRGCRVTAYDLSPQMLSFAAAKAAQLGLALACTADEKELAGRTWPVVTCIGVLDYYPDPLPLLRRLENYVEQDGRLIVTWPNALSPLGWLYFVLSRFTTSATPRTPGFVRAAAQRSGLRATRLLYAFPAGAPLGFTLVVELQR
jgi:2-polyprenyl-3-methyl-5-hydroxy-6-metoxy-1,4-benzoquinol methylase